MRKFHSMLATVLAVVMILTTLPFTATAAIDSKSTSGFVDFPTGWSYDAMTVAVENGLLTGYGDGTIRPQGYLTRAEMAAIINRAFGAEIMANIDGKFTDVTPDDWFYNDIAKAVNMQTFAGDDTGNMRPNEPITRQDAVVVLARALVMSSRVTDTLSHFVDGNEIDGYAQSLVCSFIDRGYLNGYEDKTLRGKNHITREEFAQIMDNVFADYLHTNGDVTVPESRGEVVLTGRYVEDGDTVRFHDAVIHGDLVIGDGLGTADILIENVTIEGRIVLRGGEGTVTMKNVSVSDFIVTNDVNGTVHFMHYSNEPLFTNAVYNTPATFLDREIDGGSASGKGLLDNHDTNRVGNNDAKTGTQTADKKPSAITPSGNGGSPSGPSVTYYTVSYYKNETDTTALSSVSVASGSTVTSLPSDPTNDGYDFDGWFYKDGTIEKAFTTSVTIASNLKVYAKWSHTVTFLSDNMVYGKYLGIAHNATLGSTFPEDPTKSGYEFAGWFIDGTITEFKSDTPVTANITVTAQWLKLYTVTFVDANGNTISSATKSVADGKTFNDYGYTLPAAPTAPVGQVFVCWQYNGGETMNVNTVITADITVSPKFTSTTHTLTFMNGETQIGSPLSVAYGTNAVDSFPDVSTEVPPASMSGYVNGGWYYLQEGTKILVDATAGVLVTGNMTFYINWYDPNTYYTVTFMVDGDQYGDSYSIRDGHSFVSAGKTFPSDPTDSTGTRRFAYWKDESDSKFDQNTLVTSNRTLTAVWESRVTVRFYPNTVNWNEGNGTPSYSANVFENDKVAQTDFDAANTYGSPATGYVADGTTIVTDPAYDNNVTHQVNGEWYYKHSTGTWTKFTADTKVTADITKTIDGVDVLDLVYRKQYWNLTVNAPILNSYAAATLTAPYNGDTLAYETMLDLLYSGKTTVPLALQPTINELYGKEIVAFGVNYTPIGNESGNEGKINDFRYNYRLINLLGEDTIRGYTETAIRSMVLDPANDDMLKAAIGSLIDDLADDTSPNHATVYNFVLDYFKTTEGKNALSGLLDENKDMWIDYLLGNDGKTILTKLLNDGKNEWLDYIFADTDTSKALLKDLLNAGKTEWVNYILGDTDESKALLKDLLNSGKTDWLNYIFSSDGATALELLLKNGKNDWLTYIFSNDGQSTLETILKNGKNDWIDYLFDTTDGKNALVTCLSNNTDLWLDYLFTDGDGKNALVVYLKSNSELWIDYLFTNDNGKTQLKNYLTADDNIDIWLNYLLGDEDGKTFLKNYLSSDTNATVWNSCVEALNDDFLNAYFSNNKDACIRKVLETEAGRNRIADYVSSNKDAWINYLLTNEGKSLLAALQGTLVGPLDFAIQQYESQNGSGSYRIFLSDKFDSMVVDKVKNWNVEANEGATNQLVVKFESENTAALMASVKDDVKAYLKGLTAEQKKAQIDSILGNTDATEQLKTVVKDNRGSFVDSLITDSTAQTYIKSQIQNNETLIRYAIDNNQTAIKTNVENDKTAVLNRLLTDESDTKTWLKSTVDTEWNSIVATILTNDSVKTTIRTELAKDARWNTAVLLIVAAVNADGSTLKTEIRTHLETDAMWNAAVSAILGSTELKNVIRTELTSTTSDMWNKVVSLLVENTALKTLIKNALADTSTTNTKWDTAVSTIVDSASDSALKTKIKTELKNNTSVWVAKLLATDANIATMLDLVCDKLSDTDFKNDLIGKLAVSIRASASDDAFVVKIVEIASEVYKTQIDDFIDSLKNNDKFVINNDNKFIILALHNKLHGGTSFAEIKSKLPSAALTVLDETVLERIYNETLAAYTAQVDAVYNEVITNSATYGGADKYVDTCCLVTVDLVEDVFRPEYNRAFGIIDGIHNELYEGNPYIKLIENLMKIENLLEKKGEDWYLRSAQHYYDLIYTIAVLSVDATNYTFALPDVTEAQLDAYIDTAATRIGGYLDKIIAKVTFLQNGKVDSLRNRGEQLVHDWMDKNNSELWNTKSEKFFGDKASAAYTKAKDFLWNNYSFDVNAVLTIDITTAPSITVKVTDGTKTVEKSLEQLLADYAAGRTDVTVSGTVVTVKGKSYDASDILEKLVARFGTHFTIQLEKDVTDSYGETLDYRLTVNAKGSDNKLTFTRSLK